MKITEKLDLLCFSYTKLMFLKMHSMECYLYRVLLNIRRKHQT